MSVKPFRVLLLDSHELSLKEIRATMSQYADMEIVGEAAFVHDALEKASKLKPDIVLMEAMMPFSKETGIRLQIDAIETAFNIWQIDPKIKLMVFTTYSYREFLGPLRKAGISAWVFKEEPISELHAAITAIKRGGTHFNEKTYQPLALFAEFEQL